MALTYLKIFADMEETLSLYSDEERGKLFSAMMAYSFRGEEPEFTGAERFVWPMLRNHIDSCEERSEKMKANGKRGGKTESKPEANESKGKQTEANESKTEQSDSKIKPIQEQEQDQDQDHEQEHVHDQDHKRVREKRTRFAPPTVEECDAFFTENGSTILQATRFHSYYTANGWKVGKNQMKDWKAAARGWILRDKDNGSSASPSSARRDVMQRHNYTSADFKAMVTALDAEENTKPKGKDGDRLLRYSPEERKKTFSAAVVDFDD